MRNLFLMGLIAGIFGGHVQAQDGQLDTSFNATAVFASPGTTNHLSVQSDNKIMVLGSFALFQGGHLYSGCIRLNPDGSADTSFKPAGIPIGSYRTAQVQSDGKMIIGGVIDKVYRLQPNGNIDNAFDVRPSGQSSTGNQVLTSLQLPDGKIYLGGDFDSINGSLTRRVVRLNADGSIDPAFNMSGGFASSSVRKLASQPDGKLLVAGGFSNFNGINRQCIARLNPNGTLDTSFNPGSGPNSTIFDMVLQPDGKIIIVGNFTSYNGTTLGRIARLNSDGSLDPSFNIAGTGFTNNELSSVALQADGKIVVAGSSTQFNGQAVPRMVRLLPSGQRDSTFNSGGTGPNGNVNDLAIDNQGRLLLCGVFSTYNGQNARVARLLSSGGGSTSTPLLNELAFELYPNPARETAWLRGLPAQAHIGIYDMQGRLIKQQTTEEPTTALSLDGLEAGLYVVRVSQAGRSSSKRLLVGR